MWHLVCDLVHCFRNRSIGKMQSTSRILVLLTSDYSPFVSQPMPALGQARTQAISPVVAALNPQLCSWNSKPLILYCDR